MWPASLAAGHAAGHRAGASVGRTARAGSTLVHTVVDEYIPFIVLLFSLYTISGGIRIAGDLPAHALTNTTFMLAGGLLASFIGTTGAAMLLIRPLVETNRERRHVAHTIVFFIFIVCNCGGLLLPLGDPPLFLGYLAGVEFLWTLRLWKSWLLINGLLLAVYFAWDHFFSYPREAAGRHCRRRGACPPLAVFGAVAERDCCWPGSCCRWRCWIRAKPLPRTDWKPWFYLREAVQLSLVLVSLVLGVAPRSPQQRVRLRGDHRSRGAVHRHFHQHAAGARDLEAPRRPAWARHADQIFLGDGRFVEPAGQCADVSGVFRSGQGQNGRRLGCRGRDDGRRGHAAAGAISLGAVMMGAMTYIGNGPNFMVKTIAEKSGIKMPSFFGYTAYSCCVLLPILCLDVWLFGD